jgi:hypothetical protein
MWDFIIYGLIVVNIVVLLLLLTREIKLGRACTTNASLPSPSNMPASGGTPQGIEHSTVLTPGPPLISDMNGETQFSTQKPLPAAGSLLFSLLFLTISSPVTESRDSEDHPIYQAEVHYFYSVNGVTYANNKVSFVSASSSDRSFSNRIVARYPAGKIAQVSYDPAQPKTAVLEPVLYTSFLLFYGIGGVFILTSLLFLYLAGRRRFNERPRF